MDHLNSTPLPGGWTTYPANKTDFNSAFTRQALPVLYVLISVVGLVLNGLAAWIFFRVPSDSGLVVYLKNMVVADLLMLATFPWRAANEVGLGSWWLRGAVCRYTAVLFYSSMYVSIVFIGLIGLERYAKIVHSSSPSCLSCASFPGGASSSPGHILQSVGFARGLALLTWALLLLSVLPNVLLTSMPLDEEGSRHCMRLKTPLGLQWHKVSSLCNVALFWLTLLTLAFCYASISRHVYRSHRRVRRPSDAGRKSNRSIFSVLAVFVVCFVPYHVCRVPYTLSQMPGAGYSAYARFVLYQLKEVTLLLSALNVCLDPVVYFLMCRKFREDLLRKLPGGGGGGGGKGGLSRRSVSTAQSLSNIGE